MEELGYKTIEECQEIIQKLEGSDKAIEEISYAVIELDKEFISSMMIIELKKREDIRAANEYFQRLKISMISKLDLKLSDFCEETKEGPNLFSNLK